MREDIPFFNQRVVKDGIYDVKLLVSEIKNWYRDNDYDWRDLGNVSKDKDKGVEVSLTFEGSKDVDDYFRRTIRVEILLVRAKKVTVKDMKLDSGKIELLILSTLTSDYKHLYHSAFADFLKKMKDKYVNYYERKGQIGRLFVESQDFISTIKHALGMP